MEKNLTLEDLYEIGTKAFKEFFEKAYSMEKEIKKLKKQKDLLLKQRPAPIKPGWKMPKAPICDYCGTAIKPVAYFDADGISFSWDECCRNCNKLHNHDPMPPYFEEWPFEVETVFKEDLIKIGFEIEW